MNGKDLLDELVLKLVDDQTVEVAKEQRRGAEGKGVALLGAQP